MHLHILLAAAGGPRYRDGVPVRTDADVRLPAGLASPHHQLRAARAAAARLRPGRRPLKLLGELRQSFRDRAVSYRDK